MNFISDILYWISTGLLVPVIVLLIILFCRAILLAGSFYGQYLSIRKTETLLRNELSKLTPDTVEELSSKLPENSRSLVITYMRQVLDTRDTPAQVQRLLANFEIAADKDLAISKTLTKLGPILGLMGTLIPMGPALAGLASGDIASMAYNHQVWLYRIKLITNPLHIILQFRRYSQLIYLYSADFIIMVQYSCDRIMFKGADINVDRTTLNHPLDDDIQCNSRRWFEYDLFCRTMQQSRYTHPGIFYHTLR